MDPVMNLSREDVRNFYILCLGRPVESDEAAEARRHQTPRDCALTLLLSGEFEAEILRPILDGRKLKHAGLSERTFRKIRNWAAAHAPAAFGREVPDPETWRAKWAGLLLDLVTGPVVRPDFARHYPDHESFFEALAQADAHNDAIVAAVEEVNAGRCRGFILDVTDRSRRLVLLLRINGRTVASVPVLEFRKELQERYGGSGHDGFDLDFADVPETHGLATAHIDLVEPRTGHVLLEKHTVTFSNAVAAEQRDRMIETLRGYRGTIDGLIAQLDGHRPQSVTTVAGYGRNRVFARRPEAPSIQARVAVLIEAGGSPVTEADLAALREQTCAPVAIHVLEGSDALAAARAALRAEKADLVLHLRPGERLEPDALAWLAYAAGRPGAWIAYGDGEAERAGAFGSALNPVLRSALDTDLLLTSDTYDAPLCLRAELLDAIDAAEGVDLRQAFLLHALERHGRCAFRHVPLVLSRTEERPREAARAAARQAASQAYLDRAHPGAILEPHADTVAPPLADRARVRWPASERRRISLIVPTRDSVDMVLSLVASLKECTRYLSLLSVHVVSNNSVAPQTERALALLEADEIVTVSTFEGPFNWAAINDAVIRSDACAEIAVCLNNDMICRTQGWDELLRAQLARPDVDVVGGRLLYANGTIQHAGVAMVGHWMHEAMGDAPSHGLYGERTRVAHECAAVTGAFMAFERAFYLETGGFDAATFPVTHNDVDFCLTVEKRGARILYDPEQVWTHFESVTRGLDSVDAGRAERVQESHEALVARLPRPDYADLACNPHFVRGVRPFTALAWPARETVLSWIDQQETRHAVAAAGTAAGEGGSDPAAA